MREPWLLVGPGELEQESEIALADDEARHAIGALRCREGDPVVLSDGEGVVASGKLVICRRSRAVVEIGDIQRVPPPAPGVALYLSVLHTKAMDWAIQKAVEVGAESFTPVVCARTQLGVDAARGRAGHWGRVARQALKQCRRAWGMKVFDPVAVDDLMSGDPGPGVVADPEGAAALEMNPAKCRRLVIGPEGGLTNGERCRLFDSGWGRVNLGPHVLRSETAAVVGAAMLGMRLRLK